MQAYSDPEREDDPHALPDVEVWEDGLATVECPRCGDFDRPESHVIGETEIWCPSCERCQGVTASKTKKTGWFYWFCFPGCMPDSEVMGPFETEEEALEDARGE